MEINFRNVTIYGEYIHADTNNSSDVRKMKNFFWTVFKRLS